eukprot:48199-Eustigmatos_ZCMA.PRE.1
MMSALSGTCVIHPGDSTCFNPYWASAGERRSNSWECARRVAVFAQGPRAQAADRRREGRDCWGTRLPSRLAL